ncbi:MAG: F0F1 ATP synthase subunit delta [Coriobacteriia bacterium]|nr:F0F1 ATP synthase subunit delta [Coriobacteriia bacterium]
MKTNRLVINGKIEAYAKTLCTGVFEQNGREELAEVRNQIRLCIRQLRSNPKFIQALKDEALSGEQLEGLIANGFAGFNPILLKVVGVMASNRDMELLPRVFHAFDRHMADDYNLVTVDVTTAVELDDHLRGMIRDKVEREIGKDAIINERINKDMLGGIVMTAQGKRIDASVRAQMNKARIELKKNNGGESK